MGNSGITPDTLLFAARGLRQPGVPVFYTNSAMPQISGRGVLVKAPPGEEKAEKHLAWWEGEIHGVLDPMMQAFGELVGPEFGHLPGRQLRVDCPWCLEIDLSKEAGRAAAWTWAVAHAPPDSVEAIEAAALGPDADEQVLRDLCWRIVRMTKKKAR